MHSGESTNMVYSSLKHGIRCCHFQWVKWITATTTVSFWLFWVADIILAATIISLVWTGNGFR